jgi:S-adenosylmethionine:tRNA-ribosyltransferase-isomerase (queuine synthetase)
MHLEWCENSEETSQENNESETENKRIIAVGATVNRTMQSVALK